MRLAVHQLRRPQKVRRKLCGGRAAREALRGQRAAGSVQSAVLQWEWACDSRWRRVLGAGAFGRGARSICWPDKPLHMQLAGAGLGSWTGTKTQRRRGGLEQHQDSTLHRATLSTARNRGPVENLTCVEEVSECSARWSSGAAGSNLLISLGLLRLRLGKKGVHRPHSTQLGLTAARNILCKHHKSQQASRVHRGHHLLPWV